jgi:hypothetical protein
MFHMLTCFNLKPTITIDEFHQSIANFTTHLRNNELVHSTGPIGRRVTGGALMSTANTVKIFLYLSLIALGIYWATLSHWLYFWDELVRIGGFVAIEMNVSEWRDELPGEQATA